MYGIYELKEDYNQAEKLFYKIEQFIETLMKDNPLEYSKELAYVKIQLATIEADKENYTKAIELYENAVTLLETEADGQLLRQMYLQHTYRCLADCYSKKEEYKQSVEKRKLAIQVQKDILKDEKIKKWAKTENQKRLLEIYNEIIKDYENLGNNDEVENYKQLASSLRRECE